MYVLMTVSAFPSFPRSRFYGGAESPILAATSAAGRRLLPRDAALSRGRDAAPGQSRSPPAAGEGTRKSVTGNQ